MTKVRSNEILRKVQAENDQLRSAYVLLSQRLIGLRMIQGIAQDLATDLEVDHLLGRILHAALNAVEATAGALLLLDPTGRELIFAVVEQGHGRALQGQRISVDEGLAGWVVRHNEAVIVDDPLQDERFAARITDGSGLRVDSMLCAPLVTRGQVIGVLQTLNKIGGEKFDDDDLDLLSSFAAQSATAIETARLVRDLKRERDRLIAIEEEVHHQLARDLHDGPAQLLASMLISIEFTEKLLARKPERVPGELEELRGLALKAMHQVRTLLFELRPVILETQGLAPALQMYVQRQEEESGLACHLEVKGFEGRLVPRAERAIFDTLHEAMGNVRKHAMARNVWIGLEESGGCLRASVRDDGRGFDQAALEAGYDRRGSLGMLNMRERAAALGGTLAVQSRPGAGTTVVLSVPVGTLRAEE